MVAVNCELKVIRKEAIVTSFVESCQVEARKIMKKLTTANFFPALVAESVS
jgi:hypothetical protein